MNLVYKEHMKEARTRLNSEKERGTKLNERNRKIRIRGHIGRLKNR